MNDHDHLSGGSYRQNSDGSLTLLQRTGAKPCKCELLAVPLDEDAAPVTSPASRRKRNAASTPQTSE